MTEKPKGWRGSAELWLNAAYDILIRQGVDAVRVQPLARAVGMSRPSFYWHFTDRQALLDALIEKWQQKNTGNLIAQTEKSAQTIEAAIFHLFDCWLDDNLFDAKLDFAIRSWAKADDDLMKQVRASDLKRMDALAAMYGRFGYDPEAAYARGSTVYFVQVGYISMMMEEPKDLRIERMPDYVETFTGTYPTQAEIEAFRARHLS